MGVEPCPLCGTLERVYGNAGNRHKCPGRPKPSVSRDLPADAYPFTIEFIDANETVVHSIEVSGPGVVEIPGLAKEFGPVGVRMTYANGTVVTEPAPRS